VLPGVRACCWVAIAPQCRAVPQGAPVAVGVASVAELSRRQRWIGHLLHAARGRHNRWDHRRLCLCVCVGSAAGPVRPRGARIPQAQQQPVVDDGVCHGAVRPAAAHSVRRHLHAVCRHVLGQRADDHQQRVPAAHAGGAAAANHHHLRGDHHIHRVWRCVCVARHGCGSVHTDICADHHHRHRRGRERAAVGGGHPARGAGQANQAGRRAVCNSHAGDWVRGGAPPGLLAADVCVAERLRSAVGHVHRVLARLCCHRAGRDGWPAGCVGWDVVGRLGCPRVICLLHDCIVAGRVGVRADACPVHSAQLLRHRHLPDGHGGVALRPRRAAGQHVGGARSGGAAEHPGHRACRAGTKHSAGLPDGRPARLRDAAADPVWPGPAAQLYPLDGRVRWVLRRDHCRRPLWPGVPRQRPRRLAAAASLWRPVRRRRA
ncbi:hypothetical protein IWQ56_006375, partial [Coemansia nantahalensis]